LQNPSKAGIPVSFYCELWKKGAEMTIPEKNKRVRNGLRFGFCVSLAVVNVPMGWLAVTELFGSGAWFGASLTVMIASALSFYEWRIGITILLVFLLILQ
jgi:hypothetical protein